MADSVFVNPYNQPPQAWCAQGAKIYISGDNTTPVVCLTGITAQIQRTVSDQYPLGTGSVLRLVGAPQGTAQLSSLIGPKTALKNFLDQLSNICKPVDLTIVPIGDDTIVCDNGAIKTSITLIGCTAVSVGIQIAPAQGGMSMVGVPIGVQFVNMQWTEK